VSKVDRDSPPHTESEQWCTKRLEPGERFSTSLCSAQKQAHSSEHQAFEEEYPHCNQPPIVIMATVAPTMETASTAPIPLAEENAALKKENEALKTENAKLKAELKKRKATSDHQGGPPKKAKTPAQTKKLFEKWVKALARTCAKHKLNNPAGDLFTISVKETTPWSMEDFTSLFVGGEKIQPLPDNKPTSQITILKYRSIESIQTLFGAVELSDTGYTVQNMRQRNFSKSFKRGDDPAKLTDLEVHYNKSKQTLQLNFGMEHVDNFKW